MRPPDPSPAMPRRPGLADIVIGTTGAAMVRLVLVVARLWARLTGAPWHR